MKVARLFAVSSLALAAGAAAQCDIYRTGVPDFDQKRSGLPNNGSMYCVPTSSLNWMAYIANHGDASLMGHSSSNWASNSEYGLVFLRLYEMGSLSNTSSTGGTSVSNAVDGIADYMNNHGVDGYYIINGYSAHDDWAPSPKSFYNHMKAGFLVNFCFGYYDLHSGVWERDGGHCMTVVKVQNACTTAPTIGFHNPNNDSSLSTQAAFETGYWTVNKIISNFDGDTRGQWEKVGASGQSNRRFIDKMISIQPMWGVSLPAARANGIQIHRVAPLTNEPLQEEETVPSPLNVPVIDSFPSARDPGVFVITAGNPPFVPARLYFYDLIDRTWNPLTTFSQDPIGAATDRFSNIYINLGASIQKYVIGDGSVRLRSTLTSRYPVDAMAFEDSTDYMHLLSAGRGRILSYPGGDIGGSPLERTIPAAVNLTGTPLMCYNPKLQRMYIGASGSPSIWGLDTAASTAPWTIVETLAVPPGNSGLMSLHFSDRGILSIFSRSGYGEFGRSAASGQLVPVANPIFHDRPMNGFLRLVRSQTNFNPLTDTLAKWHNVTDPVVDEDSRPECQADFNFDGIVDLFDYLDFVEAFSRGDMTADFNFDGTVDLFDYLDFVDVFSGRC